MDEVRAKGKGKCGKDGYKGGKEKVVKGIIGMVAVTGTGMVGTVARVEIMIMEKVTVSMIQTAGWTRNHMDQKKVELDLVSN